MPGFCGDLGDTMRFHEYPEDFQTTFGPRKMVHDQLSDVFVPHRQHGCFFDVAIFARLFEFAQTNHDWEYFDANST